MTALLKRVTLEDVAKHARVSNATVSRTIHSPDIVKPETRSAVYAAIRELGFSPNLAARSLVSSRTRIVAALVPSISNPIVSETVAGLSQVLEAEQYQLLLGNTGLSETRELEVMTALIGRRPDGIILIGESKSPEARALIRRYEIPTVQALGLPQEIIDIAVGYSDFDAARDLTRDLLDAGHRSLAFVGAKPGSSYYSDRRYAGFRAAVFAAGGDATSYVAPWPNDNDYDHGAIALQRILVRKKRPSAVFFASDALALGAMLFCLNSGITVPQEISLVGFGGQTLGQHIPPGLTTIRIDGNQIGTRTARNLLLRMADQVRVPQWDDVGYRILHRGSVRRDLI